MRNTSWVWGTRLAIGLTLALALRTQAQPELARKGRLSPVSAVGAPTKGGSHPRLPAHGRRNRMAPVYTPIAVAPDPTELVGGDTCDITITLDGTPDFDQVVDIGTNQPSVFANLPSSVVVAAGTTSTTFQVGTNSVSNQTSTIVSADCNGGEAQSVLVADSSTAGGGTN